MDRPDTSYEGAAMRELGARLRQERLNQRIPQRDLASEAGISEPTLRKMEAGDFGHTRNLLRVLRALGLVDHFTELVPKPAPSPVAESDLGGKTRQRVSRREVKPETDWQWGDDE